MPIKSVYVFAVLLVFVQMVASNPAQTRSTSHLQLVSIIQLEEPCVRQGGICLRIEDCDPDNLVQMRGVLCPMQSHIGVECCYASDIAK